MTEKGIVRIIKQRKKNAGREGKEQNRKSPVTNKPHRGGGGGLGERLWEG